MKILFCTEQELGSVLRHTRTVYGMVRNTVAVAELLQLGNRTSGNEFYGTEYAAKICRVADMKVITTKPNMSRFMDIVVVFSDLDAIITGPRSLYNVIPYILVRDGLLGWRWIP